MIIKPNSFLVRVASSLFLVALVTLLFSSKTLANESTEEPAGDDYGTEYDYIMSLEGPSSITPLEGVLYRYNDGSFKGTLGTKGVSAISCVLSGNAGGVETLYYIYIRWSGDEAVQSISANNLKITNTSALNPKTYHSGGFHISGLSGTSGYKSIGTCYIPKDVKKVRIKSTGLQAFFYTADFWIRLNEINGILNLP